MSTKKILLCQCKIIRLALIMEVEKIPKDNFFRRCIVASYSFCSASRFGKNINSSPCSSNSIFSFFLNSKLRYGCSYKASSENVLRQACNRGRSHDISRISYFVYRIAQYPSRTTELVNRIS